MSKEMTAKVFLATLLKLVTAEVGGADDDEETATVETKKSKKPVKDEDDSDEDDDLGLDDDEDDEKEEPAPDVAAVRKAIVNLQKATNANKARALLKKFGADTLASLDEEKYAEVIATANKLITKAKAG